MANESENSQNNRPAPEVSPAGEQMIPEMPLMNTLSERVNKAVERGYTENFKMTVRGLLAGTRQTTYAPDAVTIVDFFRFEGQSDPADNAIMYLIETNDGLKGVLIDAYGTYADENINKFIADVESISKLGSAPQDESVERKE